MIKYEIRAKAWVSGALVQVVAVGPLSWKCIPGGVPFSHLVAAQTEMRIWNKMMWCLNTLKKYQGLYCASFPCIFAQLWCENIIKFYLDTFFLLFFFIFKAVSSLQNKSPFRNLIHSITEIQKKIFSYQIIHTFQSYTNTALLLLSEIFDSKWSVMGWHDLVDFLRKALNDWFSPQFVFSEISHFPEGKRSGHALQLNRTL